MKRVRKRSQQQQHIDENVKTKTTNDKEKEKRRNLSTMQKYYSVFGAKTFAPHIGDADTHFRKTLRKYNEINFLKNTSWIKTKESTAKQYHTRNLHIELQKACGDQNDSDESPRDSESSNSNTTDTTTTIEEEQEQEENQDEDEDEEDENEEEQTPKLEIKSDLIITDETENESELNLKLESSKPEMNDKKFDEPEIEVTPDETKIEAEKIISEECIETVSEKEIKLEEELQIIEEQEELKDEEKKLELETVDESNDRNDERVTEIASTQQENVPDLETKQIEPEIQIPPNILPKMIICTTTKNLQPKIIICDNNNDNDDDVDKKKRPQSSNKRKTQTTSDVTGKFAKQLSMSYEMQEKLAADNVDLETKRFQLQKELLNKDKFCEDLQKKVTSLQGEVRILFKENTSLNDKLAKVQPQDKCRACCANPAACSVDMENRLQNYSHTTNTLEKQVETMEMEVKQIQNELGQVQRERIEMEKQRKLATVAQPQIGMSQSQHVCRPSCHGPCRPIPGPTADQQLRELREQYNRLQDDFKTKVMEVAALKSENDNLRCLCKKSEDAKNMIEMRKNDLEKDLEKYDQEKSKLYGSKEQLLEQEQQITVAKQRYREAQDEIEEMRTLIVDQASQLDDYRNRYLHAQEQVEEQRRQIDMMEMENNRIGEQVSVEIQRVKNQFQERLAELSPLPDILKGTQLKVQEEQQLRMLAERNSDVLSRELQSHKEQIQALMTQLEKTRSDQILSADERVAMQNKVNSWECKCSELNQNCEKLKTDLTRGERLVNQYEKRLDEKEYELAQVNTQLESVREESARQVARIKDRSETTRRSMQGQISDMERQLAQARAAARFAQKDRDEVRQRMQAQISNLNESFEEAQVRIRSLQGHVNYLKTSYTNMFGAGEETVADEDGCTCGAGVGGPP